jgi:hypothetical protein
MLQLFIAIGRFLNPWGSILKIASLVCFIGFSCELFLPELLSDKDLSIAFLLGFLWGLNAVTLADGFSRVPELCIEGSWWRRFKVRLLKSAYAVSASLFVVLTLLSVWLSIRLTFVI